MRLQRTYHQHLQQPPNSNGFFRRQLRLHTVTHSANRGSQPVGRTVQAAKQPQHPCRGLGSTHSQRRSHRITKPRAESLQTSASQQPSARAAPQGLFYNVQKAGNRQLRKLDGLWGRFIPMVSL